MTAREEILGRVRSALRDAPPPPTVPRDYAAAPVEDLLSMFVERVEDYRATVVRCMTSELDSEIAAALDGAGAIVPGDLPWSVPGAIVDSGQRAAELDRIDAVVTAAAVAIALTGTVVLDHGPGRGGARSPSCRTTTCVSCAATKWWPASPKRWRDSTRCGRRPGSAVRPRRVTSSSTGSRGCTDRAGCTSYSSTERAPGLGMARTPGGEEPR